jgi:hypothetical protein
VKRRTTLSCSGRGPRRPRLARPSPLNSVFCGLSRGVATPEE